MTMKRTELEKRKALKLRGQLENEVTADRFGRGSSKADPAKQPKGLMGALLKKAKTPGED